MAQETTARIRYFVSYVYTRCAGRTFGFGNCEISRPTPIEGPEDIEEIAATIREGTGNSTVTVLQWQRFEERGRPA